MNHELFVRLARQCQAGDPNAPEALLLLAHTPISWLCGQLLHNDNAARHLTRELMQFVHVHSAAPEDPEQWETWIRRSTAARCFRMLEILKHRGIESQDPPETVQIPRQTLDEAQTALAVQQMADQLPEQSRLCLLLYCCGSLEIGAIARLTGSTEDAVTEHLIRAQDNINNQLRKFHKMGIRFAKITSLPDLLQTAMYLSANSEAAAAMADSILHKPTPVTAAVPVQTKPNPIRPLLMGAAAAALLLLTLLALLPFC